jgi:hypothetical protein
MVLHVPHHSRLSGAARTCTAGGQELGMGTGQKPACIGEEN